MYRGLGSAEQKERTVCEGCPTILRHTGAAIDREAFAHDYNREERLV